MLFTVRSTSPFYSGWLAYMLGEPTRPEPGLARDGWDLAAVTPGIQPPGIRVLIQAERGNGNVQVDTPPSSAFPAALGCTVLTSCWCPTHGTCTCTHCDSDAFGVSDMDDVDCPLHGEHSDHAEAEAELLAIREMRPIR